MLKPLCAALTALGAVAASAFLSPPTQAVGGPVALVCDNTRDDPYTGTYASVTVPEGASCYLRDAVVTGNLKALHGSGDVMVIDTEVQRNIHVRGSEGQVKIGPPRCGHDPIVGNNIKVTRSHNVTICFMTVGNNIMVTRNDGQLVLRNNDVGRNVKVTNNLRYDRQPGDGDHPAIEAIRLFDNVAGGHIVVKRNPGRTLLHDGNSPAPTT